MTSTIDDVKAVEILDSRGNPTMQVTVKSDGNKGTFRVPSGASTGAHEAHEARDGVGPFGGRGVSDAIEAVESELAPAVEGMVVQDQQAIDQALVEVDGTDRLERLGANAVLGVSGAVLHTAATIAERPLYRHIATEHASSVPFDRATPELPTPMVNILSGGLHAEGGFEVQDVLVIPRIADSFREAIEVVWDVRHAVRERIVADGYRPLVADEGGFAPPVNDVEAGFEIVVDGIEAAGYEPGPDVALAIDVAAVHFYDDTSGVYYFESTGEKLLPGEMVERVLNWVESYPIVSVEDPLNEDDWDHWAEISSAFPKGVQLLGDDLIVTNVNRLERAIDRSVASAVLVKFNQAGTMSRTFNVIERAAEESVAPVVSARSGETCDTTIVDLATGFAAGQIKVGSLARSERLSKYNRGLTIEKTSNLPYGDLEAHLWGR